ncbi:hypothetical protein JIX56_07565 [Streptomyces sp. CA-210063]|uniref:hypothetical protein n=1 Tax=Streptomyces sp. CA-210063 TaxID=2801029 RepID=UPI00214CC1DB|nr:hypothetical protein [Streptomyces sp. CA-210063]UUU29755.1 hypothetical protein JIX56_07565 [Streptomyces sp. CA-210063]
MRADELALVYVSGHGARLVRDCGEFHFIFIATDTDFDRIAETGVSAGFVSERAGAVLGRAEGIAMIDCCRSGGFAVGLRASETPLMWVGDRETSHVCLTGAERFLSGEVDDDGCVPVPAEAHPLIESATEQEAEPRAGYPAVVVTGPRGGGPWRHPKFAPLLIRRVEPVSQDGEVRLKPYGPVRPPGRGGIGDAIVIQSVVDMLRGKPYPQLVAGRGLRSCRGQPSPRRFGHLTITSAFNASVRY